VKTPLVAGRSAGAAAALSWAPEIPATINIGSSATDSRKESVFTAISRLRIVVARPIL
jgi:hypothetical protein